MNIITLDFETYYDDAYTLSKMTTEEYVRDPRFKVHGCAVKMHTSEPAGWFPAPQLTGQKREDQGGLFGQIDWDNTAVLCHHAHFDGLILSHHYGRRPRMYLDTLSMARLLFGPHIGKSLENLAEVLGIGKKTIPYDLFKGKHWHELTTFVRDQVANGACDDVQLTWDLFQKLATSFPQSEYQFVDATVRMFTNPVLVGNTDRLADIWQKEETQKRALLDELGVTTADLRKQWKFAELLRAEGVEPEQKPGKPQKCTECNGLGFHESDLGQTTCPTCEGQCEIPKWNYSFAKTDDFMREILDSEDERLAMLAQAKLDAHSTGTITRVARLGWMSTRGNLCVYLNYAGTHLSGWSGGDKVNWQNFKRGGPIGTAIEAPKGFKMVVADASQIECRLLNKTAGQDDVIERFRNHEDPYVALATTFYGETVYRPTKDDPRREEMEQKRGTGKQGELSCGYGAGDNTIMVTAKKGTYGPPVYLTLEEAGRLKKTYRSTHPFVEHLWDEAGDVLKKMAGGMQFEWNVVEIKDKIMYLPNDVPIRYDTLEWHQADDGDAFWRLRTRRHGYTKIYGAKLVENLIQALRNVFIRQAWAECMGVGLDMVSMEHDKLIAVVREHEAVDALAFMQQALSRPPSWLPDIPLDSEGYISSTLAKE